MKTQITVCDKCSKPSTKSFFIFKERKADAAGGMEDWNYTFDLCADCCALVLEEIFSAPLQAEACVSMLSSGLKIKMRVE